MDFDLKFFSNEKMLCLFQNKILFKNVLNIRVESQYINIGYVYFY